jgi:anti-anti-sigma regulatory factor
MSPVDLSRPAHSAATRSGAFAVRRLGERLAVVCAGSRLDEPTARAYSHAVLRATTDGVRELVLDLSAVRYHAWPAIYALCELEAHLIEACCDPVAVAADASLVRDLEAVGLERAWSMCPSVDVALTQLLVRPV